MKKFKNDSREKTGQKTFIFSIPLNVCTSSAFLNEEDADVAKKKKKKTNSSDGNARTFRRGARAGGAVRLRLRERDRFDRPYFAF